MNEFKSSLLIDSVVRENIANAKFLETLLFAISGNLNKAVESYESFLEALSLTKKAKTTDTASMRDTFDSAIESLKNPK
jgi:hypothetical protein